jgi:SAM-dependent methyltransferase
MVDAAYLEEEKGRRLSARRLLRKLNAFMKPGSLLEIGSATGFFLDEAARCGWQVYGVEVSEWATRYAKEKLNLTLFDSLESLEKAAPGEFDAIVLLDVLEHLTQPKDYLQRLRKKLKPKGILCISTPDIDSALSRILKARWWGIKWSHLYYFSRKTLYRMLDMAGFRPVRCASYVRIFNLRYLISRLKGYRSPLYSILAFFVKHGLSEDLLMSVNLNDQILVFARKLRRLEYIEELEDKITPVTIKESKMKIVVVLPAYNAASTLAKTVTDIPKQGIDEIILVDDASSDNTSAVAKGLGLITVTHKKNLGYGANQKTCYQEALKRGADIIVMVHPDYQYDPKVIPELIVPIQEGKADAVFGSRMMKGGALEGGMPLWKHSANILLTALENIVLGTYLTEYHSGFRAYSRRYLESINFMANNNGFVFDTEIIVQGLLRNMRIEEIAIRTRYFDEASTLKLIPSIIYGLGILKTLLKFLLYRLGLISFRQFQPVKQDPRYEPR